MDDSVVRWLAHCFTNWQGRFMAFYRGYFDESYSDKSPVFVVAGFVATVANWIEFEAEWKAVLAEFGISAYHARYFCHRQGEFIGWDEDQRQRLMSKLLAIIGRYAQLGFASVVHQHEFKKIIMKKHNMGSVYNMACAGAYLEVGEWAKRSGQTKPIWYYFDEGHTHAKEAYSTYFDMKKDPNLAGLCMGSITFTDDIICVPLQAADLAAYEIWKWLDEHFGKKTMHGRYPLQEIIKIPWCIREFDKGIFEQMRDRREGKPITKKRIRHFVAALRPGRKA
ncbi:MAG TPA: DUF3800 domain-containing protein [Acidobacteriaceae bacterium]|jgi:hypothetical protein